MAVQSISLKDFPPSRPSQNGNAPTLLAEYLQTLLNSSIRMEQLMFLPSLPQLAQFFNCSSLDVLAALDLLKAQGYQYLYLAPDGPVTIAHQGSWKPDELARTNLACLAGCL